MTGSSDPGAGRKKTSRPTTAAQIAKYTVISAIVTAVIGLAGIGVKAYFDYLTTRTEVEVPIHATQTAEAQLLASALATHGPTLTPSPTETRPPAPTSTVPPTVTPSPLPTATLTPSETATATASPTTTPAGPCAGANISIINPTHGQTVPEVIDVVMGVTGTIPPGCRVALVIKDPLEQCWAWLHAKPAGGLWSLPGVTIGVANDTGKSFRLTAVITDQALEPGQVSCYLRGPRFYITVIRK
jgi:hypothetical protein